jgi:Ser/Thr protein kinase RdoA (MazF antagonist)
MKAVQGDVGRVAVAAAGMEGWAATGSTELFPVAHAVFDAAALGAELASAYQFAGVAQCRLVRRGFHDTYVLAAGGQRYAVRVYRALKTAPEIAYELELLVHLASRGVSVAGPVVDRAGRLSVPVEAPEGIRYAAVFTFADGRSLSWNPEESRCAGRLLGSIHSASESFATANERSPLDLTQLVTRSLAVVGPFLEHRAEDWCFLVAVAGKLQAAVSTMEGQLEWGVCHGDFNTGNIHVGEDGSLTAFDFDFCGPGWRAYDLVGAWRWAAALDMRIWTAFLDGYRSVRHLGDIDAGAASLFDGISRLRSLGLRAANAAHRGTQPIARGKVERHLNFLRSWVAQHLDQS